MTQNTSNTTKTVSDSTKTRKKTGIAAFSHGRTNDRLYVKPQDIHIKTGLNCRNFQTPRMQAQIKKLADLMVRNGFDTSKAIHCYYDEKEKKIYVKDGETRHKAVLYALENYGEKAEHLKLIPITTDTTKDDDIEILLRPINSNTGLTPTLIEIAWQIAKIAKQAGGNIDMIAERTTFSHQTINRYITIYNTLLPHPKLQDLVHNEQLSVNSAMELVKEADHDPEKAYEMALEAQKLAISEKSDPENETQKTTEKENKTETNEEATDQTESTPTTDPNTPPPTPAPKIMPRHIQKATGNAPNLGKALRDFFGSGKKGSEQKPQIQIQRDPATGKVAWIMPEHASRQLLQAAKIDENDVIRENRETVPEEDISQEEY